MRRAWRLKVAPGLAIEEIVLSMDEVEEYVESRRIVFI